MNSRYFIVINPIAERGQSILRLPILNSFFDAANVEYEVHITTGPLDGYMNVLNFCTRNPDCAGIIGVGGDGIIQEIVCGMADAFPGTRRGEKIPIPLGILPSAAGSDFVLTLDGSVQDRYKASPNIAVRNFFDKIMKRNLRAIDIITAGNMSFINVGHVGLDAKIAQNAAELKYKYDQYAYWVAGFKSIARHENTPLDIEVNGETLQGDFTLAAVCNGKFYGGGLKIAPDAEPDDGKITLCLIEGMNRVKLACSYPSILRGSHLKLKTVRFISCDELTLRVPSTTLCLDSNFYQQEGELKFKVLPNALEVFV